MNNIVILLTACVNPNGMSFTTLCDSNKRLEQYLKSVKWYLENTEIQIVFVENSGYDISPFFVEAIRLGRLECLAFDGNNYDRSLGKGYGEAEIIEHAVLYSKFIMKSDAIIKITGRIIIKNIDSVIASISSYNCVYTDFSRLNNDRLLSVIVVANKEFWGSFVAKKELLNDSKEYFFEHLLKDEVGNWIANGRKYKIINRPLLYEGISGSTGISYKRRFQRTRWLINMVYYNLRFKYILFRDKI